MSSGNYNRGNAVRVKGRYSIRQGVLPNNQCAGKHTGRPGRSEAEL